MHGTGVSGLPQNKSSTVDDQRNESRFKQKAQSPKLGKMAKYPASLNGINKNLP